MQRDVADTVKLCIYVGGQASHRSDDSKELRDVGAAYRFARHLRNQEYRNQEYRQWCEKSYYYSRPEWSYPWREQNNPWRGNSAVATGNFAVARGDRRVNYPW